MRMQTMLYLKIDSKFGDITGFRPPTKIGDLSTAGAKIWKHIEAAIKKITATSVTSQYLFLDKNTVIYAMQADPRQYQPTLFSTQTLVDSINTAIRLVAHNLIRLAQRDNHTPGSAALSNSAEFVCDDVLAVQIAEMILSKIRRDNTLKNHEIVNLYMHNHEQLTISISPSTSVPFESGTSKSLAITVLAASRNTNTAHVHTDQGQQLDVAFSDDDADLFCYALYKKIVLIIRAESRCHFIDGIEKTDSLQFKEFIGYGISKPEKMLL